MTTDPKADPTRSSDSPSRGPGRLPESMAFSVRRNRALDFRSTSPIAWPTVDRPDRLRPLPSLHRRRHSTRWRVGRVQELVRLSFVAILPLRPLLSTTVRVKARRCIRGTSSAPATGLPGPVARAVEILLPDPKIEGSPRSSTTSSMPRWESGRSSTWLRRDREDRKELTCSRPGDSPGSPRVFEPEP